MKKSLISRRKHTYVIAEIGQAHDGSLGILHSFVDALAKTGVDAIKFQVHLADKESSHLEKFRKQFSIVDSSRFAYWKRMELSLKEWLGLKRKCESLGVEFLATPFSNAAVDLLQKVGVRLYKVGSGDAANPLLLKKIAATGKEIILSTGLVTQQELDLSVSMLRSLRTPFTLLQCCTNYPAHPAQIGLGQMVLLHKRYQCPVGLSDHSGKIFSILGAVALGARVVEAHACFDRRMFGPDAKASLTIDEWKTLVEGIRFLEKARGPGMRSLESPSFKKSRRIFGKAISLNQDLKKGKILKFEHLEGKKPMGAGVSVLKYQKVVGSRLKCSKKAGDFLHYNDILKK